MIKHCTKYVKQKDISSKTEDSRDLIKKRAWTMLDSYGLSQTELEYFSYYFGIIRTFPLPSEPKTISLPYSKKPTLVLDLDETMVHAEEEFDDNPNPFNNTKFSLRPGLKKFLAEISALYELIVFTAATERHADPLLKVIDRKGNLFRAVFYRRSCVEINGYYIKDLRILETSRDLSKVIIVDDSLISLAFNLDNGIAISPYMGEQEDNELELLGRYLKTLALAKDLRAENAKTFRLSILQKLIGILS